MTKLEMGLGPYRLAVEKTLTEIDRSRVIPRIWDLDHTVWKMKPDEITNRLGWLTIPSRMRQSVAEVKALVDEVRGAGYTHALLLGMGGSSLAPDVFRRAFGVKEGFLDLSVLDSTDPAAVAAQAEAVSPEKRLFIVSSKSGTTAEVMSFFKYFYNQTVDAVGKDRAGEHFIAITDPGNPLNEMASKLGFRRVVAGDPNIGGRFSALSVFGLVPAALMGIDISLLLDRAMASARSCEAGACSLTGNNDGCRLGAALGAMALAGRDKLTFFISDTASSFGDWVEQLIAESTGKERKGILPVVSEAPDSPELYSSDRVFVSLKLAGDTQKEPPIGKLRDAGHPVMRIFLDDLYDLGGQFFLWEFATAVAGHVLEINPYDQPDVESAKVLSRKAMDDYRRTGVLSSEEPTFTEGGITVFADRASSSLDQAFMDFLSRAQTGSYISIQAYIYPARESYVALQELRTSLLDTYLIPTTVGFGPRFLHSTGQLHKGDAGKGFFIQITCDDASDLPIPDEAGSSDSSMSFGILKAAQAMGDGEALKAAGRPLIRFHISGTDIPAAIMRLAEEAR